jgi:signal transduction histidine kinase
MSAVAPRVPNVGPARRDLRDWLIDTGAFLLAIAWVVLVAALWWTLHRQGEVTVPPALLVVDVVAGAVAAGAVWLRRRWPVGLAVALLPTGLFSMATGMPAVMALFSVAVRRRPAVTLLLGGLYAATTPPYFAYQINPLQPQAPYWWDIAWGTVITALVVGWGLFARERLQLLQSLHERAVRAEAEQQLRAEQARHLERQRIAREMHDVLAHRISLVSMHAGGLEFRPDASPEEVARAAAVIRRSAHEALEDLREVIGVLRAGTSGGETRPQPTLADLPALLDESQRAGTRVRVDNRLGDLSAVPAHLGRTAYRIVQEGLTNARKHAAGTVVDLSLSGGAGDGITIELRNPKPVGHTPTIPGSGTGLVGLAERATLTGGRLEHGPTPDGGYRLRAWLPWPA